MFIGEFETSLDGKGRVVIPARMREVLRTKYDDGLLILTHGLDQCLAVYPYEEWQKVAAAFKQKLPVYTRSARWMQRQFYRSAIECRLDGQGRLLIPPKHRQSAHIEKEVVITGCYNRIEIWGREVLEAYDSQFERSQFEESLEDLADRLDNLLF